jgi:uracil-DNA glycosylase family 4
MNNGTNSEEQEAISPIEGTGNRRSSMDLARGLTQYLGVLAGFGMETLPASSGRIAEDCWSDWLARQEQLSPTSEPHRDSPPQPARTETGADTPSRQPAFPINPAAASNESQERQAGSGAKVSAERPGAGIKSESHLPVSETKTESKTGSAASVGNPVSPAVPSRQTAAGLPLADRLDLLQVLQTEVETCRRCPALVSCRSRTVFGAGNVQPRLVLLGEAPGEEEDRTGVPFVGAAGQLLDKILAACGLKREEVYILNTVKCRPPFNRNPAPEELDNCWEYTLRQLEILNPEFICCLGAVASKRLLQTELPLGKLRQRLHDFRGIKVLVTYHPAYLLRTDSAKKQTWEDMQMLLREMGLEIPKRK